MIAFRRPASRDITGIWRPAAARRTDKSLNLDPSTLLSKACVFDLGEHLVGGMTMYVNLQIKMKQWIIIAEAGPMNSWGMDRDGYWGPKGWDLFESLDDAVKAFRASAGKIHPKFR